jgi:D-3-phosphoglycerate dehydrogenase
VTDTTAAGNLKQVLLCRDMHPAGRSLLEARPDLQVSVLPAPAEPELDARIHEADAVFLWLEPITAPLLTRAPRLKVVSRYGVGYDTVDIAACTAAGVAVGVANGSNDLSVAEHTMMLLLAVARNTVAYDARVRSGGWRGGDAPAMSELAGRTILVVGYGRIGTRVARLAAAFGMKVMVHDPNFPTPRISADGHLPAPDLTAVLPQADVLTLHCPLLPATRNMIDAAAIARMKDGAWLINTARGPIVDQDALTAALRSGKLAAAGLDVLRDEPPDPSDPLLTLPNVTLAPHNAAQPVECLAKMAARAAQNILDVFDGTADPGFYVNPEVLRR